MNSRAPDETLLTTGVSPGEFVLLTIIASTPINLAVLKMLPKFIGSVIPSKNRKKWPLPDFFYVSSLGSLFF